MGERIPKDVMLDAMRALMVPQSEMVDSVARALMARDERAAEIARKAGNTWSGSRDHMVAIQEAAVDDKCEEIATAILTHGGRDEQR